MTAITVVGYLRARSDLGHFGLKLMRMRVPVALAIQSKVRVDGWPMPRRSLSWVLRKFLPFAPNFSFNPYDYAKGRGMARSSCLASCVVGLADIPIIGETMMRLRTFFVMKSILDGGVSKPRYIPPELLNEMYLTGNRSGHYRAFISLLRNAETWEFCCTLKFGRYI